MFLLKPFDIVASEASNERRKEKSSHDLQTAIRKLGFHHFTLTPSQIAGFLEGRQ